MVKSSFLFQLIYLRKTLTCLEMNKIRRDIVVSLVSAFGTYLFRLSYLQFFCTDRSKISDKFLQVLFINDLTATANRAAFYANCIVSAFSTGTDRLAGALFLKHLWHDVCKSSESWTAIMVRSKYEAFLLYLAYKPGLSPTPLAEIVFVMFTNNRQTSFSQK